MGWLSPAYGYVSKGSFSCSTCCTTIGRRPTGPKSSKIGDILAIGTWTTDTTPRRFSVVPMHTYVRWTMLG